MKIVDLSEYPVRFVFNFNCTNINKIIMDSFSISELAQYSGIKSHTIRIWEKRYDALRPDRSAAIQMSLMENN